MDNASYQIGKELAELRARIDALESQGSQLSYDATRDGTEPIEVKELTDDNRNDRIVAAAKDYNWRISYHFPGPLPVGSYSSGCSGIVNAGSHLGRGRFCDYIVLGIGGLCVIDYNRFDPVA